MKQFAGYHEDQDIPVKKGDVVTIRKGTTIRTTMPTTVIIAGQRHHAYKTKIAGRTYKVRVDHVLNGVTTTLLTCKPGETPGPKQPPSVRWPGTGGYWFEVDINDIPEATGSSV